MRNSLGIIKSGLPGYLRDCAVDPMRSRRMLADLARYHAATIRMQMTASGVRQFSDNPPIAKITEEFWARLCGRYEIDHTKPGEEILNEVQAAFVLGWEHGFDLTCPCLTADRTATGSARVGRKGA